MKPICILYCSMQIKVLYGFNNLIFPTIRTYFLFYQIQETLKLYFNAIEDKLIEDVAFSRYVLVYFEYSHGFGNILRYIILFYCIICYCEDVDSH